MHCHRVGVLFLGDLSEIFEKVRIKYPKKSPHDDNKWICPSRGNTCGIPRSLGTYSQVEVEWTRKTHDIRYFIFSFLLFHPGYPPSCRPSYPLFFFNKQRPHTKKRERREQLVTFFCRSRKRGVGVVVKIFFLNSTSKSSHIEVKNELSFLHVLKIMISI